MRYLRIGRSTLYRRIDDGTLPAYRVGGGLRFYFRDVRAMVVGVCPNEPQGQQSQGVRVEDGQTTKSDAPQETRRPLDRRIAALITAEQPATAITPVRPALAAPSAPPGQQSLLDRCIQALVEDEHPANEEERQAALRFWQNQGRHKAIETARSYRLVPGPEEARS